MNLRTFRRSPFQRNHFDKGERSFRFYRMAILTNGHFAKAISPKSHFAEKPLSKEI
jgi:hypothetical protein